MKNFSSFAPRGKSSLFSTCFLATCLQNIDTSRSQPESSYWSSSPEGRRSNGVLGVRRRRPVSEKKGKYDERSSSSYRSRDLKLSAAWHAGVAGSCSSMHLRLTGEVTDRRRGCPVVAVTRADRPTSDARRRRRPTLNKGINGGFFFFFAVAQIVVFLWVCFLVWFRKLVVWSAGLTRRVCIDVWHALSKRWRGRRANSPSR